MEPVYTADPFATTLDLSFWPLLVLLDLAGWVWCSFDICFRLLFDFLLVYVPTSLRTNHFWVLCNSLSDQTSSVSTKKVSEKQQSLEKDQHFIFSYVQFNFQVSTFHICTCSIFKVSIAEFPTFQISMSTFTISKSPIYKFPKNQISYLLKFQISKFQLFNCPFFKF